jgi:desulfoferrodoxin (superoxide reductase-like protein)
MDKSGSEIIGRREFLKSFTLTALSAAAISAFPKISKADIGDVLLIENISQNSMGKIRLKIRHVSPTPIHYISIIEVDVDGQIMQFNLEPQDSDPFTVELDLGEIQGTPNVRARAYCNLHGWSEWSDQIEIPEFPTPIIAILGALAASLFFIKKSKSFTFFQ